MSNFADYVDEAGITRLRAKGGGGGSSPLKKVTVGFAAIAVDTGQGLASVLTVAENDVIVVAGIVITEAFNDTGLTGIDAILIDGEVANHHGITIAGVDMTNENVNVSPYTGRAGSGSAGYWFGTGGSPAFISPRDTDPGLPFVAGPGGSPIKLFVNAWNGDGDAGSLDVYALVLTPVAP